MPNNARRIELMAHLGSGCGAFEQLQTLPHCATDRVVWLVVVCRWSVWRDAPLKADTHPPRGSLSFFVTKGLEPSAIIRLQRSKESSPKPKQNAFRALGDRHKAQLAINSMQRSASAKLTTAPLPADRVRRGFFESKIYVQSLESGTRNRLRVHGWHSIILMSRALS